MNDDAKRSAASRVTESWQRIDSLYNHYGKSIGIGFTAMLVLECVNSPEEVFTQKGICEKFGLPKQAVNSIINSFREQGYLELKEARDRRNKELFLTESGKAYAQEILGHFDLMNAEAWKCFTTEETIVFAELVEKYEKSFESVIK